MSGDELQSPSATPRHRRGLRQAGVAVGIIAAFALGLSLGGSDDPHPGHPAQATASADTVYTCSMHPQVRSGEPGKCPLCAMDLIPVQAGAGAQASSPDRIALSARAHALARIRTAEVRLLGASSGALHLLGRVDYDETRLRTVTAWVAGRVDRLHVATTGERIAAGQVIATLYSPDLYSAQQDLTLARKQLAALGGAGDSARKSAATLLEAARRRLELLGVPAQRIDELERADAASVQVPVRSPLAGTVIERLVSEGDYVQAGAGFYRVADLSRLWVQLDAYEHDLPRLRRDQIVKLHVAAVPGEIFEGRVAFIDPTINPSTRTARVRVEVQNPKGVLRPGMFAEAVVASTEAGKSAPQALLVPDTAPLFSGRRSLVYVEVPGADVPTYEAREVQLGPKTGDSYPVLAGLAAGEHVVVHGAFVLDADLQIRGGHSMMARPDLDRPPTPPMPPGLAQALRPLLEAYLEAQASLADDADAPARAAAGRMATAVAKVQVREPAQVAVSWKVLAPELADAAKRVAGAASLAETRQHFEELSARTMLLLELIGNPLTEHVYVAFCPMAFGARGAKWLQRGELIDNAYRGNEMRRCGEILARVVPGQRLQGAPKGDDATPATSLGAKR